MCVHICMFAFSCLAFNINFKCVHSTFRKHCALKYLASPAQSKKLRALPGRSVSFKLKHAWQLYSTTKLPKMVARLFTDCKNDGQWLRLQIRAMKECCLYHGRDLVHDLSAKLSQCPCNWRCCPENGYTVCMCGDW